MPYINEINVLKTIDKDNHLSLTIFIELESEIKSSILIPLLNYHKIDYLMNLLNNDIIPHLIGYNIKNPRLIDKVLMDLSTKHKDIPNIVYFSISLLILKVLSAYLNINLYQIIGGMKPLQIPNLYQLIKTNEQTAYYKNIALGDLINNQKLDNHYDLIINQEKPLDYLKVSDYKNVTDILSTKKDLLKIEIDDPSISDLIVNLDIKAIIDYDNIIINRLLEIKEETDITE